MIPCVTMTDFEANVDKRFDDIDVDTILARVSNNKSLSISRKRCLLRAPEFIQRLPAEETVEEGSSVTISCKLVGLPKPTVTWYKDDDVIGPDARAKTNSDNTGLHSLNIGEVSRCDVGTYKVRASNSEGSSANSLYLSVKAKSKNRNRKKKKSRAVACAPMFPAIVELDAEERRETLAVERQPESPLTPLYTNISQRSPVTWPEFLGEWGYSTEINKQDSVDLEMGCEDVFDSDDESPPTTCETLTFVSSAYAQLNNDKREEPPIVDVLNSNEMLHDGKNCNDDGEHGTKSGNINRNMNGFERNGHKDKQTTDTFTDILNNNEKNRIMNEKTFSKFNDVTRKSREDIPRRSAGILVPSKEIEEKTIYCDPSTISKIAVNRSYATGDSTFSVARRSPSPYPRSRKPMTDPENEVAHRNTVYSNINDTSTLQNLNNERILQRMKQSGRSFLSWNYFFIYHYRKCDEDHLMELFLLLCGGTFLALLLDLNPSTFVLDIFIALVIRMVLKFILDET